MLGPVLMCRWAFPFISFAHFSFTPFELRLLLGFPLVFKCSPTKHVSSNTSATRLIVNAYVLKVCLFLPFWILISSRNCSLVTANKTHDVSAILTPRSNGERSSLARHTCSDRSRHTTLTPQGPREQRSPRSNQTPSLCHAA